MDWAATPVMMLRTVILRSTPSHRYSLTAKKKKKKKKKIGRRLL
jgi:hypothetical protein